MTVWVSVHCPDCYATDIAIVREFRAIADLRGERVSVYPNQILRSKVKALQLKPKGVLKNSLAIAKLYRGQPDVYFGALSIGASFKIRVTRVFIKQPRFY